MNPDISGDWTGVLDTGSVKATLNFRLQPASGLVRLMTRTYGELVLPLEWRGARWRFDAASLDVAVELWPDGERLAGRCRNSSALYPMQFERGTAPARSPRAERPQTPRPPFPYAQEDIAFVGVDGTQRVGTLTRPSGPARGAVVLTSWYGRVDRDERVLGHRPFAIWADVLTRLGLTTLRFDKRGAGASGGVFDDATTGDSAADLTRAVAFLRGRSGVDAARVGLFGHCEGAHITADATAADPTIAFCVLLTPSGVPEEDTFDTEMFRGAIAVGGEPVNPDQYIALARALTAAGRDAATPNEGVARTRAVLERSGRYAPQLIEARAQMAAAPWRRFWWKYDQTRSLSALTCPTLALFAGSDLQAPPRWHLPKVRTALAGNPRASVVELPGLNHFLQHALTGAVSEYGDIDATLAPEAIETVCDWLAAAGFASRLSKP